MEDRKIRVGIVGLGCMGNMHFNCYKGLGSVEVAAVCDVDQSKFAGSGTESNLRGTDGDLDLDGVSCYSDFEKMLADRTIDAISITVPTFMHRDFTIAALEAGKHVLCEKPMAMNETQCREMIAAAEKNSRVLQVGHCVRFWPEYAKAKEYIESGAYGKVLATSFRRLSAAPKWSWNNWLMNGEQSGGALIDLHIHDTDFVQYLFGMPKAVYTKGVKGPSGGFDHCVTQYIYEDEKLVMAEGSWIMTPSFQFEMSFNIMLEKATLVFNSTQEPAFRVCPAEGEAFTPEIDSNSGHMAEIISFVKEVKGQAVPMVTTPIQSRDSIKLALAEQKSAETKMEVLLS